MYTFISNYNKQLWLKLLLFGSPYSYLAYKNLKSITETGAIVDLKPVLVGGIFKSTDNRPPLAIPKKFTYLAKDMARWSNSLGVEIKMNPYFPIITVPHMRGAVLAKKLNLLEVYADKMFDAIWVKALNLNDQMIMSEVAIESGIDGNDFAEGIMSEEIKNGLKINTQYALDNGAFGVPTFYFNNEMYWGIDSMKFLIDDLNK